MAERLLEYCRNHQPEWVDLLRRLVVQESPSNEKAAVDRLGLLLKAELEAVGAAVTVLPQATYGDLLRAEFGRGTDGQILVLCHVDTVWPVGQIASMPVVERDGKLFGPGSFDMKGGVMFSLAAMRAMRDLGMASSRKIVLLYNTEEELGSPASRAVIEAEAKRSDVVLVLEPTVPPNGAVKTSRKGVGRFTVKVTGRPSHAGGNPKGGISAVEELARQVLLLHGQTDYEKGTYVNVGLFRGGTRANVVAAEAVAEVDVRVTTRAEGERISKFFAGLTPFNPEAQLTVTGGLYRPPMERSEAMGRLYEQARSLAAELGFALPEGHTGGGSDGNFTAALGIPTLDGLGAVGDGAHAFDEHVELGSIPERIALLALLLCKV